MKKWILIGLAVVVVVIAGVVVLGLSKIGPIIKTAVNTYGPDITKTDVNLGDVKVSLFSAEAKLKDFYLGNPKGFKSPDAMKVGSILVDVDETSIAKDTIIIDRIEVLRPRITYEKKANLDNFQAILNNVTKGAKQSKSKSGESSSGTSAGGKKIIIRDFQLKGGQVTLAASLLGEKKSVSTSLPDIHLKNIGEKNGGLKPEEAFRIIFSSLSKHIHSPDVMKVFSEQLKGLKIDPKEIKGAGEKLKNLLGK